MKTPSIIIAAAAIIASVTSTVQAVTLTASVNKVLGTQSTAYVKMNGTITTTGTQATTVAKPFNISTTNSNYSLTGSAYAEAAMLGSNIYRLAEASATVAGAKKVVGLAPATKTVQIQQSLKFNGASVYTYNSGIVNGVSLNKSFPVLNKTFTPARVVQFGVGPLTAKVTPSFSVDLSTSATINYDNAANKFTGNITPGTFDCTGKVIVSAVGGVVSANGTLNLCKVSTPIVGACDFNARNLQVDSARLNYTALAGKIDLSAFGFNVTILSFPGFSGSIPFPVPASANF